jgi:hypothetical protein
MLTVEVFHCPSRTDSGPRTVSGAGWTIAPAAGCQCAAKGVGGLVVLTAGFAEVGGEGRARQVE